MFKISIYLVLFMINLSDAFGFNIEYKKPDEMVLFMQDFYPIGWSKDGKFSYIETKSGGGKSNYLYALTIVNLLDDEILYIMEFESDENNVIADIWKDNYSKIKKELNEFKIIGQDKFIPGKFPAKINDDILTIKIDNTVTGSDMFGNDTGFSVISILSEKFGKKILFKKDEISLSVIGYLKSPYENSHIIFILCSGLGGTS